MEYLVTGLLGTTVGILVGGDRGVTIYLFGKRRAHLAGPDGRQMALDPVETSIMGASSRSAKARTRGSDDAKPVPPMG